MGQAIIKISNISKFYSSIPVLENISFDIIKGEIFGIIGSSGSGKTTLLKSIIGFLRPEAGDVLFLPETNAQTSGLPVSMKSVFSDPEYVKKKFGFASQVPSFYSKLTVFENLDYFGSLYGLSKEARLNNINTLLELVELDNAKTILAENLSGGMQRRLDIACSIIHDPSVLILDEPTSDLDPVLAKHIWTLIQKINKRGTTIIVASHHFADIEAVCSRIAIISKGALAHVGTLHELTATLSRGQEIHLETYPGNYEKILKNFNDPLVVMKENRGNKVVITTGKPDKVLSRLLHILAELDETLMDVSINRLSLNDVFSKVARKTKK